MEKPMYMPILKWRQGEYLAVGRASEGVKDWIHPLFEIPIEQWDFENEAPAKSLDEHLKNVGNRLAKNWKARRCLFDSPYLAGDDTMADGQHHLERVFDLTRTAGCQAVPVTGIDRHADYQQAVARIIARDDRGCGLRLVPDDLEGRGLTRIPALLKLLGLAPGQVDLILDSSADVADSPTLQSTTWQAWIAAVPDLVDWRSITIAGGSFPASLSPSSNYRPHGDVNRREWRAYTRLAGSRPDRMPWFGDYGCASPQTELMDPRLFDPNAKIKYTTDDQWRIVVGTQIKRNGRDQYRDLCNHLVSEPPVVFMGRGYSWGDEYIEDCANNVSSTGGSSTWPTVATNHHLTKVVRDLANLAGASSVP
ncbi:MULTISPECIES: beta family protein [Stenotrophomonas]|nr:beta family protein [Stenotrophomonas maltophilia]